MPNVKVLLNQKIEKLGEIGEIVSVKPGYARNFLLPQGLATMPSVGEVKRIKKKRELLEKIYQEERTRAEGVTNKINELGEIVIFVKATESGKLYGKVTTKDIVEKINSTLGTDIQRKQVLLKRSIVELGEHEIKLKLHNEVTTQIKVVIKKEEE